MKRGPLGDAADAMTVEAVTNATSRARLTMSDTSKGSFVAGPGASSGVFSGRGQLLEGVEG